MSHVIHSFPAHYFVTPGQIICVLTYHMDGKQARKGDGTKLLIKKKEKKNQNLTELYINCRLTTNNDSKTPNKRGFSCSATCQDEVTHAAAEFKPENASARHSHTPRLMVGRTSHRTNSEQTQGTMTCLGSVQLGYFFIVTCHINLSNYRTWRETKGKHLQGGARMRWAVLKKYSFFLNDTSYNGKVAFYKS